VSRTDVQAQEGKCSQDVEIEDDSAARQIQQRQEAQQSGGHGSAIADAAPSPAAGDVETGRHCPTHEQDGIPCQPVGAHK
jgi:hypothetical protein